jgi:hypothetical protein
MIFLKDTQLKPCSSYRSFAISSTREGSKEFAKRVLVNENIPTAYDSFIAETVEKVVFF